MNDLISRLEAAEAIYKALRTPTDLLYRKNPFTDFMSLAIAMAQEIPSAQQWIPCSERLPEEVDVLCCDKYGQMLIATPFKCDSDTGFSAESDECYMYNCIAWMPRPEPYKP